MHIGAVIITYNPDIEILAKNIRNLLAETDTVLIVDNGSNNIEQIKELQEKLIPEICIIPNNENRGIAAALNQGFEHFKAAGYDWVITMDQDSWLMPGAISKMNESVDDSVGIICPRVRYLGWPEKTDRSEDKEEIESCMTSASLTNVSAWEKCGKFNADYFIDYVDDEFCKKMRLSGYRIIRDNRCVLEHRLGNSGTKKFLGKTICFSRHSPVRCYYMARNVLVFNRTFRKHLNYRHETLKAIYIIGKNLLFCGPKLQVIRYTIKGIRDAGRNKLGKVQQRESTEST